MAKYQKSKPKPPVERVQAKLPPNFKSKALRPKPEVDTNEGLTQI